MKQSGRYRDGSDIDFICVGIRSFAPLLISREYNLSNPQAILGFIHFVCFLQMKYGLKLRQKCYPLFQSGFTTFR